MVRRKVWLATSIVILLLVMSYLAWVKVVGRRESFQGDVILQHNLAATARSPIQDQGLQSRSCAVYFTERVAECDDTKRALYHKSLPKLEAEVAEMERSGTDPSTLATAKEVLEERKSGRLPNGLCKLAFKDWVEPVTDHEGAPMPFKHQGTENELRGASKNWAYCYTPATSTDEASQKSQAFSDGRVVMSDTYAGSPFRDGKLYGRVSFNSFGFDNSFCSKAIEGGEAMPSSWVVFKLSARPDTIESFNFVTYNPQTQTLQPYEHWMEVLFQMFDSELDDRTLWLKPKTIPSRMHYLQFDPCGRVAFKGPEPQDVSFSLSSLGFPAQYSLFQSMDSSSDTYGTIEQLEQRLQDMQGKEDMRSRMVAVQEAIQIIRNKTMYFLSMQMQQLASRQATLDRTMVSNDGNLYMDMGPFLAPPTPKTPSAEVPVNTASTDGPFDMEVGGQKIKAYMKTMLGRKWTLVLNYHHKAGTNPELRVIQKGGAWPMDKNLPLGADGSTEAAGTGWGHVGTDVLRNVEIQEMLWYATNGTKEIHFTTTDPEVIEYCKTGTGGFPMPFENYMLQGGNASLPERALQRYKDQGDFAMTEFPFWRWGQAHWAIRGMGRRWEVDDFANGFQRNTIHQVWIR